MKLFSLFFVAINSVYSLACAQTLMSELKVGDKLPNGFLEKIIEVDGKYTINPTPNGKMIILDFWNRYCSSCIQMFPKIEQLNKEYADQLIILPVTRHNRIEFEELKSRSKILKEAKLPFVLGDSILAKIFPHKFVPFYVWINRDGKIVETSGALALSKSNIKLALAGDRIVDYDKKEEEGLIQESFNTVKKKLITGRLQEIKYYSKISHVELEDLPKNVSSLINLFDSTSDKRIGWRASAHPLSYLIGWAYGHIREQDMIFDSNELRFLVKPNKDYELREWYSRNIYNYDLVFDPEFFKDNTTNFKLQAELLKKDLRDQLGISGKFEDINRRCLVLLKVNKNGSASYKVKNPDAPIVYERTKDGIFIQNGNFTILQNILSEVLFGSYDTATTIVNEMGDDRIDVSIEFNNDRSLEGINKALGRYGIALVWAERTLRTLIVTKENISVNLANE